MSSSNYPLHKIITLIMLVFVCLSFNKDEPKIDLFEKVYAHTDRPMYFPNETIWFKGYVVNASNTISAISEMMYVDLISPKGAVVLTKRLPVRNGYSYGSFHINKDWVGGIYKLKMYTNWMRNYDEATFFTKAITVQKVVQPNLLMYLKFEKVGYGKSSEVVADFELKNLKNAPLSNTEVNMAVMLKGKTFLSQKLKTNTKGKLKAKFKLPGDLETTDVLLNMLIPYKGSTESISRSVPVLLDNLDLQFFPESGKIILGTENTVAFKAINEFGKPADVSGQVIDENGNQILEFDSFHDGMGAFKFEPTQGTRYFAQVTKPFVSTKKISLPDVHQKGVRFTVEEKNDEIKLSLYKNITEELRLKVSNEAGDLLIRPIKSTDSIVSIATDKFPMGITKLSITGERNVIFAERLVFINSFKQLNIDVQIEKETFDTR